MVFPKLLAPAGLGFQRMFQREVCSIGMLIADAIYSWLNKSQETGSQRVLNLGTADWLSAPCVLCPEAMPKQEHPSFLTTSAHTHSTETPAKPQE